MFGNANQVHQRHLPRMFWVLCKNHRGSVICNRQSGRTYEEAISVPGEQGKGQSALKKKLRKQIDFVNNPSLAKSKKARTSKMSVGA